MTAIAFRASAQFGEPWRNSIDHQDVNFEPGIVEESSEFGVRELRAAGPVVIPAHGVIEEAACGDHSPMRVSMPLADDRPRAKFADNRLCRASKI
jgi:hypothetical protein